MDVIVQLLVPAADDASRYHADCRDSIWIPGAGSASLDQKPCKRIAMGMIFVLVGLTLFLEGLEMALFPVGRMMAEQLTGHLSSFMSQQSLPTAPIDWRDYLWVFAFALAIVFATTLAEPALLAVAIKAKQVSAQPYRPSFSLTPITNPTTGWPIWPRPTLTYLLWK